MANPYSKGLGPLCAAGMLNPKGQRVLLKAILATDNSGLIIAQEDTLSAACHEVVAAGPDVTKCKVGEHVLHISAAGDHVDDKLGSARYTIVHEDDVVAGWSQEQAETAFKPFSR